MVASVGLVRSREAARLAHASASLHAPKACPLSSPSVSVAFFASSTSSSSIAPSGRRSATSSTSDSNTRTHPGRPSAAAPPRSRKLRPPRARRPRVLARRAHRRWHVRRPLREVLRARHEPLPCPLPRPLCERLRVPHEVQRLLRRSVLGRVRRRSNHRDELPPVSPRRSVPTRRRRRRALQGARAPRFPMSVTRPLDEVTARIETLCARLREQRRRREEAGTPPPRIRATRRRRRVSIT